MRKGLQIAAICVIAVSFNETRAQVVYQQKQNKVSNVSMWLTNHGIYGFNIWANTGGTFWPRGSSNQYIFGGGIWFGALKTVDGNEMKVSFITYNPNSGQSWAVPGRIEDGKAFSPSQKYNLFLSTEYDPSGSPYLQPATNWPVWWNTTDTKRLNGNFGIYVHDENKRTSVVYTEGPAYVSAEDAVSVFKDTDVSKYDDTRVPERPTGFPLGIQYEQAMYSWSMPLLEDVIVMRYTIINTSQDVLKDCYFAPALDADLAISTNTMEGSQNDHTRYFLERPDLRTAIQWTEETAGEKDFGVMAVSFLETPAVDGNRNLRKDKQSYKLTEQLGLHTFRNWIIANDPLSSAARYEFMSSGLKDGDNGPGDKRFLISTGPFTMQPGDTARIAVSFTFANRLVKQAATKDNQITAEEDYTELISKIEAAQKELYPDLVASVETENLLKGTPAYISFKNDIATLNCKSDSFKNIRAELFNTLGERMMIIHNGETAASEITFTTSRLPAGMYYCVITSSGERMTLPMTIVR